MADDMVDVLRELSSLLRRLTEQNDLKGERTEKMRLPDFAEIKEQATVRLEEGRKRMDSMHQEDLKFKRRLIEEIERHNQLIETLIAKMGRS